MAKAITVTYRGPSATLPGRYIATDSDNNRAISTEGSDTAAVRLMRKGGALIAARTLRGPSAHVFWMRGECHIVDHLDGPSIASGMTWEEALDAAAKLPQPRTPEPLAVKPKPPENAVIVGPQTKNEKRRSLLNRLKGVFSR